MATQKYVGDPLTVTIGQAATVELPPRILRARLRGMLFETDKTFLLPVAMKGIRGLVSYYQAHPDMIMVVTGHTDRVGDAEYNRGLSDERARSMANFLRDQVDPWLQCYRGSPHSKVWGTREDQYMLSAIVDDQGAPFYSGPVHGNLDAPTRDAVTRYQASRGLTQDGTPGDQTRRALITDYMKLDGTTLPASTTLETLGCGENHNEVPTPDGVDEQENRRVEIFLFDGRPVPERPDRCPGGGCAYPTWKRNAQETVDFDHDLCELMVQCLDGEGAPLADTAVTLSRQGSSVAEGTTDSGGLSHFVDLIPGRHLVLATKKGYRTVEREVVVRAGAIAPASYQERKGFVADDSGTGPLPSGNAPVVLNLDQEYTLLRIVGEIPDNLTTEVKEGVKNRRHEPFADLGGYVTYPTDPPDPDNPEVYPLHFNVKGESYPTGSVVHGELTDISVTGVHAWPIRYRTWDPATNKPHEKAAAIDAGKVVEVKISSRVRLSVLCFFPPFVSITQAQSLDDELLKLLGSSGLDDVTIVSVVAFVPPDLAKGKPASFTWDGWWPIKQEKYLKMLIERAHAMGVQVVVGWGAVDKGGASTHKELVNYLAAATDQQIDELAETLVDFFDPPNKFDIDGIMFDFELNGLGPTDADLKKSPGDPSLARSNRQRENVRRLFRATADKLYQRKPEAFASYCNAPFTSDDQSKVVTFMRVQPFDIADGQPNLVARPMCFYTHTIPADEIRASVRYAIDKGHHPAHLQYAVFAKELPGEFDKMLVDTFRANRVGVALYQFPGASLPENFKSLSDEEKRKANDRAARESRAMQIPFLRDACPAWNKLLNEGEVLPSNPPAQGQPYQVPRGVEKGGGGGGAGGPGNPGSQA